MAQGTTIELHKRARAAAAESKGIELLRVAGEIVRVSPNDFAARMLVARAFCILGRESDAAVVHRQNCTELLKHGFDLAAIEVCNEALKSCPGEFELFHAVGEVYDAIAGLEPAIKARSLPPSPVVELDASQSGSILRFTDEDLIMETARDLASSPLPEPSQARPKHGIPFFSGLDRDAFVSLVSEIERKTLAEGEVLFDEGATGDALFILLSGRMEVRRGDAKLAILPAGSVFGEMALITGQARTASVRALKDSILFVVRVEDVEKVARAHPGLTASIVQFARRRMLMNVVSTSPFFKALNEADRLGLLKTFSTKVVQEGERLMTEGDHPLGLYVLASGTLEVSKRDENHRPLMVAELHAGEVLGEIALVRDMEITADVSAKTKSVVLLLSRDHFKNVIETHPELRTYLENLSESRFTETDELMRLESEELCESELTLI
jgi:CRP-like cAMP-binding protein